LKDRTTNQSVSPPLPGVGVLAVDSHAPLLTTPGCSQQLELWPLLADKPA
jgi:hypothetical protein